MNKIPVDELNRIIKHENFIANEPKTFEHFRGCLLIMLFGVIILTAALIIIFS